MIFLMDAGHSLAHSLWLRGLQPCVEQGAAAMGLSPTLLSVLCPGLHALLSATAGRSDELALLATRLAYIHGGEPVQGGWCGGGLRACRQRLRGLPEHAGQQLPAEVTHLLSGSWGCWYSCSLCAVQDGAGTATPALALAAESSKDHKYLISQERPWCWGSAVALQKEGRLWKRGLTWDRAQMCFEVVRQAEM